MTSSSSGFRVGEAESCGGEAGEDGNIYHYKEQLEQISVWLVGDDFEDFSCALDGLKCILSSILDGDLGRDHLSIIALDSISSKYSESYLSRISRVLLSRDYSNESDIVNEVSKILRMIIKVILDHLPLDNMKVVEALHYLFDPSCRFYANAGLTRPDPLSFLSEKEKASLADFKSNLTVNDWVDVSHGDLWHAAQIVDMEYQQIKVCYEASVNFNEEWIDLNSARILPFRRRSFEKVLEPWRLDLKISSKCDVIDGINKWYTATILEYRERDDCFLFNYDGWTHKYDEWISRSSYRLAPFLSIARGGKNTGGVKMESLELYLKSESETSDDCAIFRGKDWGGFHIVDNLNFFAKKLGFEKLKLQVKNLNLDLLMLYITFMSKIYLLFSQSFCSKFLLPFTQEIFLAIVYLNDIELRQLSKDKFHIICENSERVLRRLFSQYHTESRMVAFKSQVALRNFKSPIVERRLNGFDFFIETLGRLQKVDLPSSFNMNDEFVCSKKKFLKWLENNHVYEDVFASLERSHVELLKRSPELLNYYSLENCFESYHLDLIWNLLLQALAIGDNAAEIAVYKVLEQCCSFLNEANLRYLLLKLRYLESKFWSASIISLISLLSNYLTCEESIKEILSLLWNHFEDPMRVDYNKNIATLSMQKFVELIGRVEAKGQRFIFLNRAIGNLKQSPMVLQSLEIIKSIVSTYPIDEFPAFRSEPGQEALIQELESKFKIVRCVLHDIKSFKSLYKESFGDSLLTETILNGYTYLDNIKKRLQFVSYISLYSKMHIALDLLANIWHELFSCALYDCELEIFLDWLVEISAFPSESLSQFDLRPSVIDPDTLIKFFSTKLLSIPCEKVSIRSFHSLKIIMIRVNNLLGYLDDSLDSSLSQTKKVLFVVSNFNAIIGLDFSWTLVWETDNSEVLDQAVDFLLSLHNRLSDEEFSRKGNEIMKLYIKRCMDNFINFFSNQNFKKVRRCLILLNRLLDVYDFKHRFQQFVSRGKPTNCTYSYNPHQKLASEDPVEITVVNNVRNSNLPRSFIIQIYESDSMNDIRELLAASIGILPWYLRVFIDGKEVSFSEAEIVNTSSLMLDLKRPLSSCKNIVVAKNAFLNKRVELIDPISKELTNAAKSAFSKIFYRFCSSNFGVMFQEDFEKYILSCGADNAYSRVGTINEIFAEYSTKTNHHISERNQSVDLNLNLNECSPRERILDADNNHLSLENFLEFYQHYAENRPHFVWSDLQTHGFLEDLSDERIAVQQYFKQIYNDNFNPGMHLSGCNNEQDSKIFGTSSEPIFSLLFDAVGVKELEEDAWHLLMRIPTSCHLKSSILSLQLQDSSTIGWKKIVNRESPSKQLYVLQILQSIIIRSAQDFNKSFFDWMICFLKTGGLSCLFEILLSFPTEMSLCRFSRSSIYTLVQIITAFSMESLEIKSGIKRKLTALWENYSRCIKSYNNSLSARDSSDTPQPISDGAVSTSSKPYEFPFSDLIEECGASVLRENPELAKFVLEDVNLCILATRSIEIIKSIGNLTANKDPLSYGDRKVFIFCVLNIFMAVIESSDDLMPIIAAFVSNSFSSVIQILISHDLEVRHLASFLVLSFCDFSDSLLRPTFMKLMDYLLSSDISLNANYESFFLALLKILDLVLSAPLDKDIILHNYLIEKTQLLMNLLTEKSFFENGDTITHETFLAGLLQVESKLVSTLSLDSIWKNDVIKSIHSTLLFGNSITTKSICLFQNIRKLTFDLLFSLACKSAVCFQQLWDLLAVQFDRISKPIPWNYQPGKSLKSPIGYVGLKNQGSTCYMNSLLQQLFLIPQFRQGIFSAVSELSLTQTSLLYQLQVMFGFLLASERQYFETKPFCEAYTDEDGNPIDIRVQQDAQEFFSVFTDRIEMALKSSSQKYLMKSTFGGKLCNQFICLGCNNIREREEEFFTVSLEVSSRSSLVESLKAYVSDEMLTGVHCDACGEKSNTTRRVVLSELPETMIFHLKRFQLNFETFTNEKLNDRFEFPFKVDLEPYTKQHILQENMPGEDSSDSLHASAQNALSTHYELEGIVIHVGTAQNGHYYSIIKSPDSEGWIEFNDNIVKYFDPNLIPEEAFGGRYQFSNEKSTGFETEPYQGENIKNAYMLFYRRKNSSSFTNCLKDISSLPERTRQIVRDDNASLILHMQIFNPDFFHFLFRILKTFDGSVDETFLVQCTSAIFDVVARSANNEILPEMLNWLVSICKESPIIAKSALLILCRDPNMIFELVLGHHETFIRTCCCNFFSELLVIVLSTEHKLLGLQKEVVYESSSSKINEAEHLKFFVHRAAAESFVDILLGFQSLLYQNLDKSSNYFGIFLHVALADDLARFLLLKRNFISRFGSLLLGDQNSLTARGNSYSSSAVSSAFDNFIKTAVLLVRACKTDHGIPRSTVIIPSVGIQELSGMDKRIILHREFYSRSLANGYNADAIAGIMCHWAWNWTEYSRSVASIVLDGARKATEENIESYLDVCFSFLEIDDSLVDFRIQLLFDSKGNLLELTEISRHSQPMFTFLCIQKIAKATLTNIHLAEFLRQCQHRWDWFRSWLHNYPNRYLGSHKFDPSELLRVQNAALELCEQLDRLVEQFGRRIPEEVVTENNPSTSAIGTMYDSAPILSLDPSSGREILNLKAGGYSFHDPPLGEFSTDSIEGELDKLVLDDENVVPGEQASDESDQSLYLEENAPSPGESTHSSWHCSNCTYQNSLEKTTCDICSRFRL